MTLTQLRDTTKVLLEYPNLSLPNPAEFGAFLRECEEELDCDHLLHPHEADERVVKFINEALSDLSARSVPVMLGRRECKQ